MFCQAWVSERLLETGVCVGVASVNVAEDPMNDYNGFWTACSTYGSFSYLKYGPMRLFSQLAQDCDLKVGKVIWIAGHSGPETAEDSRTHFGIFAPGVTQLFPEGHVIDLHPWEYNEVPVVIAAALRAEAPIIALHLTRPPRVSTSTGTPMGKAMFAARCPNGRPMTTTATSPAGIRNFRHAAGTVRSAAARTV